MVKLQKKSLNKGYYITIPASLVKHKKWKAGQELDLRFNENGNVEVYEIK